MAISPLRVQRLYIGKRFTGVIVREEADWPGMWRVHSAGGQISDMVNLTRAKDAAITWALHSSGRGLRPGEVVRWSTGDSGVQQRPCVLPATPYEEAAE